MIPIVTPLVKPGNCTAYLLDLTWVVAVGFETGSVVLSSCTSVLIDYSVREAYYKLPSFRCTL